MSSIPRYHSLTKTWFLSLAIAAGILLWLPMMFNGSFKALLVAPLTGHLSNTIELKTKYTGFFPLDYFVGIMVGFFYPATSAQDEGYQYFVLDAYSTFACGFVWLHTEASRPGQKPKWITRQTFGAAIVLPIYYIIHLEWSSKSIVWKVTSLDRARALTPAFLLGVVAPTAIIMAPTWMGPDYRSAEYHQTLVAIFMLSPIWVTVIQEVATIASGWLRKGSSPVDAKARATWWIRAVFLETCVVSAAGHLYPAYKIMTTGDPEHINLTRLYLPSPFTNPSGINDVLVIGSWLFLQFDHIIISLSSLSWALVLLRRTKLGEQFATSTMIFSLLVGSVLIGPGATVSASLYFREGLLGSNGERNY
ncbi:hypothetical protein DL95DRAFT_449187 [Leptodontidium sp. 2 PMI_412]|nr:hypothetical protein DL95DRAFT_449187 [Leptodontidium sp. 2 PMI_412]